MTGLAKSRFARRSGRARNRNASVLPGIPHRMILHRLVLLLAGGTPKFPLANGTRET